MDIEIKYVRIVQWIYNKNSENEVYSEFVEAGFKPCLIKGYIAIDIVSRQMYPILRKKKGVVPIGDLYYLEANTFYADQVLTPQFNCSKEEMVRFQKLAAETNAWYNRLLESGARGGVIDFQKAKRKTHRRKKN